LLLGWFAVVCLLIPSVRAAEAISREITVFVTPVEEAVPAEAISREVTVFSTPETDNPETAEAISREVTIFTTTETAEPTVAEAISREVTVFATTDFDAGPLEAISREISLETSPAMPPVHLPAAFAAGNILFESLADTRPTNPDRLAAPSVLALRSQGTRVYGAGSALFSGPAYESPGTLYPTIQHETVRDLLLLHPGRGSRGASVGVPVSQPGTFLITGSFARANDARFAGNGVAVAVLRNLDAANPLFTATIGAEHSVNADRPADGTGVARFSLLADLFPDDVVRFVVFSGNSGQDIDFDVTAIEATVVPIESVNVAFTGAAPKILLGPAAQTVALGSPATFGVVASGDAPLAYQWRRNGIDLRGSTNATLAIPAVRLADGGRYTVVVANNVGSVESAPATVEFAGLPALALVDNFADRQVFTDASFVGLTNNLAATSEAVAGEPRHAGKAGGKSLWMTWRAPQSGLATFRTTGSSFDTLLAVYTGTALANLSEVASDEDRGGFLTSEVRFNAVAGTEYLVAVDGFAGASGDIVLSWELVPTVEQLPQVTLQPVGKVAVAGDSVTLVAAVTPANAALQWFANGQPVAGATGATLQLPAVTPEQAGSYRLRVTAPNGLIAESRDVLVEVSATVGPVAFSADKLEDLFLDDLAVGARGGVAPAGLPRRQGFTSLSAGSLAFNTRGALTSPNDPLLCGGLGGASRWFRFRVAQAGPVALATTNTAFDTLLAVFTNRFDLTPVACNDDVLPGLRNSAVTFEAFPGVDYLVVVDGKDGDAGACTLSWISGGAEPLLGEVRFLGLSDGHFRLEQEAANGAWELGRGNTPDQWTPVWRTNVTDGVFRYRDPEPADQPARFYRLAPAAP
jgi:hypothetical protein